MRNKLLQGVNDLATVNPKLAAEWDTDMNTLSPEDVTFGSSKKVWWKCIKGHEWKTTVNCRSRGEGCPYCKHKIPIPGETDLATMSPDIASEWHPRKNGRLTPRDVTMYSNKKVWWKCQYGHEYEARISNRTRKRGCPYCSGRLVIPGINDLATLAPALAEQWHPTKNEDLKPDQISPQTNRIVWWQCRFGHEWQASPRRRRNNDQTCPCCSNFAILPNINSLAAIKPELMKEWHPTKNGWRTPYNIRAYSKRKVWWQCECGHEWMDTVIHRVQGASCPICD